MTVLFKSLAYFSCLSRWILFVEYIEFPLRFVRVELTCWYIYNSGMRTCAVVARMHPPIYSDPLPLALKEIVMWAKRKSALQRINSYKKKTKKFFKIVHWCTSFGFDPPLKDKFNLNKLLFVREGPSHSENQVVPIQWKKFKFWKTIFIMLLRFLDWMLHCYHNNRKLIYYN